MEIRPYSKSELAHAYAPDISQQSAVKRLVTWIKINGELSENLRRAGYYKNQRMFTSKQVSLIFEYIGEP